MISESETIRSKGSVSISGKITVEFSSPVIAISCSWTVRASSGRGVMMSDGNLSSRHNADRVKGVAHSTSWSSAIDFL